MADSQCEAGDPLLGRCPHPGKVRVRGHWLCPRHAQEVRKGGPTMPPIYDGSQNDPRLDLDGPADPPTPRSTP